MANGYCQNGYTQKTNWHNIRKLGKWSQQLFQKAARQTEAQSWAVVSHGITSAHHFCTISCDIHLSHLNPNTNTTAVMSALLHAKCRGSLPLVTAFISYAYREAQSRGTEDNKEQEWQSIGIGWTRDYKHAT